MADLREVSSSRCYGGWQRVFAHDAPTVQAEMRVGVYVPPQAETQACPVLVFLSGLTCTEQNVITKAGAQRYCAEAGLILIAPDTSPRGEGVADDDAYDLGQGAGFYLDATEAPWAPHYRMASYVVQDLAPLRTAFTSHRACGITGHSMGGHGALVLGLRHPDLFQSVSAFAPISHPSAVPWGQKAFTAYLGQDEARWAAWDATSLMRAGHTSPSTILVDQGSADGFLAEQLDAGPFRAAAETAGQALTYRMHDGYDHSYYFVASFIGDHVAHHAGLLRSRD